MRAIPILAATIVGAASFTLSFFAQSEVAVELGAVPPRLGWLVALTVDGGVMAGSAAIWGASTRQARKDPVAYVTVIGLLALSVVINVHHAAASGGVLGAVIAGSPPVILLLCLELVAAQARREATEPTGPANPASTVTEPAVPAAAPVLAPAPAPAPLPSVSTPIVPAPYSVHTTWAAPARPAVEPAITTVEEQSGLAQPSAMEGRAAQSAIATDSVQAEVPAAAAPVVEQRAADASVAPSAASAARPGSQAEQIRTMFTEHVAAGGDPKDTGIARSISDALGAPLPSVRKVLAGVRKELDGSAVGA